MIRMAYASPLGELTLVSDGDSLTALVFEDHLKTIAAVSRAHVGISAVLRDTARQLDQYFTGKREAFELKLAPEGNDFQQRVWRALERLKFGDTTSYAALAREIGADGAARAVGSAVGRNPISIVIPCHRVLGASGALTGYAGGLDRKRRLLGLEGALAA
jgi:methylated-DNA-[protein]-cysteine S-methyltransferase